MMWVAGVIVAGSGLFLVGLALLIVLNPALAERFLMKYASSLRAHLLEQSLRIAAGWGLIVFSPSMRTGAAFAVFGWILVVTGAILLAVPWRWHSRFAQRVIPIALRHRRLYSLSALALGAAILASMPWPGGGST